MSNVLQFGSSRQSVARRLPGERAPRGRRDAVQFRWDLRKLARAGRVETLLYLRDIRGVLTENALDAFDRRSPLAFEVPAPPAEHARRLAEVLVATTVAGRVEMRRDAGLPLRRDIQAGEALPGVGIARAVEYLRRLPVMTRAEWEAAVARQQGRAFFMAGVENKVVLDQMRELIAESLESGLTPKQFEQRAFDLLRNYEIAPSRLRTVWNTNVAQTLSAARREELNDPEVAAVLRFGLFDAMNDAFAREGHLALDGGIAPMTWWNSSAYYPPLEWNCRCVVLAITEARARRLLESGGYQDLTAGVPANATARRLAA